MLKHLLQFFAPFLMLTFAAGASALTEAGAGASGADTGADTSSSDGSAADYGLTEEVGSESGEEAEAAESTENAEETTEQRVEKPEDKDTQDFKGLVSKRILSLKKDAPELASVFQKYPKVQEQIEAAFRRDMAYRELYPTVAEARAMREQFPNGMQDVQQLVSDAGEIERLDNDFYTRDRDGNYPGHSTILNNMFQDDREAGIAFFKSLPKEWAKLDRESYNDVMGQIVGSTLLSSGAVERLEAVFELAKEAKQDGIVKELGKVLDWANNFLREKPQPTEEERRLQREKEQFNREKADRNSEDKQRFDSSLNVQAGKVQFEAIEKHAAIKALANNKAIPKEKRDAIIEKIHTKMRTFLVKSPSVMRKLKAAYEKRDMGELVKIHQAAWSQPWLLNRMVREVMAQETPTMIRQNRDTAGRRTTAASRPTERRADQRQERTGPYQVGTRWYRKDGTPFTISEILKGKHLES